MKWWGWGAEDKTFALENRPELLALLEELVGPIATDRLPAVPLDQVRLPDPAGPDSMRAVWEALLGSSQVVTERLTRIKRSLGKSYPDLVRVRRGRIDHAPDAVLFPQDPEQVEAVLRIAAERNIAVVPFGGGTSVVGGVEPRRGQGTAAVTLDLTRLSRVVDLDEKSDIARLQAGLYGPALEAALREKGYTLQHFPQSFEFSTLGGWIATRSAGQASTKYGKIEDMVLGLDLIAPVGIIKTNPAPASATGPGVHQMLIGSEGIFGVIVEAQVKVHKIPAVQQYRGLLFKSFESGVAALRAIAATSVRPAVLRLSDREETRISLALRGRPGSVIESIKQDLGWRYLMKKGYGNGCLMLVGLEGDDDEVGYQARTVGSLCRRFEGFDIGAGPGKKWLQSRFELPYLRDDLLDRRVLVDTLETATSWRHLLTLYAAVKDALTQAIAARGLKGLVMMHISHVYPTGASLYFTFACRQAQGMELEQWQEIKKAATDAIMANHGTLSHHHGIGADHAPWLAQEHGPLVIRGLRALKATLDPCGIMNPGKLLI